MQSLSSEVVRSGAEVRLAYQEGMEKVVDQVVCGLKEGTAEERRARAWAFLSVLAGGVTMARAVQNSEVAAEIARSVRAVAMTSLQGR